MSLSQTHGRIQRESDIWEVTMSFLGGDELTDYYLQSGCAIEEPWDDWDEDEGLELSGRDELEAGK